MKTSTSVKALALVMTVVAMTPAASPADPRGGHDRGRRPTVVRREDFRRPGHGHGWGHRVERCPSHARVVVVAGRPYRYWDGVFYTSSSGGFVSVRPPLGAVVLTLPIGHGYVVVGGRLYYTYGGSFYRRTGGGYVVVEDPNRVVVQQPTVIREQVIVRDAPVAPVTSSNGDARGTVWITNANGSRTPVELERVDGRWRGPRGEYYDSLPTQEQLASVYGLNPSAGDEVEPAPSAMDDEDGPREVVVWVRNFNGSSTRVVLQRSATGAWVGERGEFYDTMPTEEELGKVYGLQPGN